MPKSVQLRVEGIITVKVCDCGTVMRPWQRHGDLVNLQCPACSAVATSTASEVVFKMLSATEQEITTL